MMFLYHFILIARVRHKNHKRILKQIIQKRFPHLIRISLMKLRKCFLPFNLTLIQTLFKQSIQNQSPKQARNTLPMHRMKLVSKTSSQGNHCLMGNPLPCQRQRANHSFTTPTRPQLLLTRILAVSYQ
uniref:Uncharacterized protein n=1 Tax=Cacopsylla melanoneura TaxID=428564 RepID=A0A8D8RQ00_9HEMI